MKLFQGLVLAALLPWITAVCAAETQSLTPCNDLVSGLPLRSRPLAFVEVAPLPPARTHSFWDRTNVGLFSGIALMRTLDYTSSINMQKRGREEILLPDDVVLNRAGFAALEASAAATSIGISYLLHATGHHKIERWLSIGHISVTGFGAARNYSLQSKHPVD